MTTHVVQFSGGIGSWAAARRVADKYGIENLVLLFADVLTEDPDTYRFNEDAATDLGVPTPECAMEEHHSSYYAKNVGSDHPG